MDLNFDLSTVFDTDIVKLDNTALRKLPVRQYPAVKQLIDRMGALSTEAQGLKKNITTYEKLVDGAESEGQVIYIMWEKGQGSGHSLVVGILKVSNRQLYLYDNKQQMHRCKPINILDFYVHTSRQRQGYGHIIYDHMLQIEGQYPGAVAIDKPSESLLCFMKKHYNLTEPVWQATHYVVYPIFFEYLKNPPGPPPASTLQHSTAVVDVVDGLPASMPMSDKWNANNHHINNVTQQMQQVSVAASAPAVQRAPEKPAAPTAPAAPAAAKEEAKGANYYAKQRMIAAMEHQSIF